MKAIYYEKFNQTPTIEEVPDPKSSESGVVVKVLASGICRSDWHGWKGHDPDIVLPHVPGHELVGEIVETGTDVKNFQKGQRITVPFVSGCGSCSICDSGNPQVCDVQFQPGFTAWGSFAEYVALDYADFNLIELPEDIDSVVAASLGCRFITAFRGVVDLGRVGEGQMVAIHGCGGVGLSAVMIARAYGAEVIAVDINDHALSLSENCGASYLVNPVKENVVEKIMDLSSGGVEVSVDALGSKETCVNSIRSLKKLGKHIQIGLLAGKDHMPEIPMHLAIARELQILGSHGMQATRYPEIFRLINNGLLDPSLLINSNVPLEEAIDILVGMDSKANSGIAVIDQF